MASSSSWKMSSSKRTAWLVLGWDAGPGRQWVSQGTREGVTAAFPMQVAGSTTATTAAGPSRH